MGTVSTVVDLQTLDEVSEWVSSNDPESWVVLGRGSNTLLSPNSRYPTVIRLASDLTPSQCNGTRLILGAGLPMKRLQDAAIAAGLSGLAFAAGVPASLGGMVAMNFGCWGTSMSDIVVAVQIVDETGALRWISASEAQFGYRNSIFHSRKWIVIAAELALIPKDPADIRADVNRNIQTRLDKQPLRDRTFGSTFKNPTGYFAGQLIEQCGLRGKRWGDVQLSDRHANFLLNLGSASFQDAVAVIREIQSIVKSQTGVDLETEVQLI